MFASPDNSSLVESPSLEYSKRGTSTDHKEANLKRFQEFDCFFESGIPMEIPRHRPLHQVFGVKENGIQLRKARSVLTCGGRTIERILEDYTLLFRRLKLLGTCDCSGAFSPQCEFRRRLIEVS